MMRKQSQGNSYLGLKNYLHEKELTLEEAKRVEIFSKILVSLKQKPKDVNAKSKDYSEQELLTLLPGKGNDDSTSK